MDLTPNAKPIACSLGAGDYRERLQWIFELNFRSLLSRRRAGLELELVYGKEAAADVRELVRREEACCGFLSFRVEEAAEAVRLIVAAPEEARSMLDSVFEPFEQPAAPLRRIGVGELAAAQGEEADQGQQRRQEA